jgi:hypothetical protein
MSEEEERPPLLLDQISLVVGDMGHSVEFYRRWGWTWARTPRGPTTTGRPWWEAGWTWTSTARPSRCGTRAGRRAHGRGHRLQGGRSGGRRPHLRDHDQRGYEGQQPPFDAFWGARYAIVCDPDGNAVGIMSPVKARPARMPPPLPD